MEAIPSIDNFFNLEEALKAYGFEIRDNGSGSCLAYGYSYKEYGEINIEFYQDFLQESNFHTDMHVIYHVSDGYVCSQKTLFQGVAPTNQHDFDMLMQLLFPSDAFLTRIEANANDRMILNSL